MKPANILEVIVGLEIFDALWRRRRVFAAVFFSTIALTGFALLVLPVRYVATSSVIVAEQEPGVSNASAAWAQKMGDPADLESQLLVIRSPRVMRLVMDAPGVSAAILEECRQTSGGLLSVSLTACENLKTDSAAFIEYVQTRYAVAAVGRSRVINISYQSPIPEVAQIMANALTSGFLDDQRAAGANGREVATSWLWQELRQLDGELRDADAKIQSFRRTKGLMRGANAPISSERLTSIGQQLSVAEAARAEAAARLQEIKSEQFRNSRDAPSVLSSRAIADLKQQLTVISAQLASSATVLGPKHPSLLALEREQALIHQRLADEVASIAASAQKAYDANDDLVKSLKKQMEAVKAEVGSATSDEASIESMVRGAEIKRQQYADLYKRASELETERRVLLGSTRLVSLAELPSKPFFPKKIPFLAAGSTIGLMLGVLACFLSDRLKPRVSTETPSPVMAVATNAPGGLSPAAIARSEPRQETAANNSAPEPEVRPSLLAAVTGVPVLARLRLLKAELPISPITAILHGNVGLPLWRALAIARQDRELQKALEQLNTALGTMQHGGRRVLITSAGTSEGKTLVTLALAENIAAAGRRVLIVECDLMHPAFEQALASKGGPGLLGVLRGSKRPGEVVVRTANPNLDVIAAGGATAAIPNLMARKEFVDLLSWTSHYDAVLFDAPLSAFMPNGPLALDSVLLCVRNDSSSIGRALAATAAIKAVGGKSVGIAVTMVQSDAIEHDEKLVQADAYARAG
jgi:succinoglycan biosynthesis transport protein ExoP